MIMSHTRTFDGGLAGTAGTPRTSLLAGYVMAFRTWRSRRAAIAQLHALDDRNLQDIGISRSEIESVVHWAGNDVTRLRRG
jgi:uncharacterized protein YjiS (DUF1127 family)